MAFLCMYHYDDALNVNAHLKGTHRHTHAANERRYISFEEQWLRDSSS